MAFVSGQFAQALGAAGLPVADRPRPDPEPREPLPGGDPARVRPGQHRAPCPTAWGTTGLCYRADLTGYDPDSWYDLLQPKEEVSGKTTALATQRWLMLPAQKALGFSANTIDPAEMEQVKQLLLAAKPTLLAYDDTTFYEPPRER